MRAHIHAQTPTPTHPPTHTHILMLTHTRTNTHTHTHEHTQFIYSSSETDFSKPFFLTFFNTSMFSLYLLGFAFRQSWRDMVPPWPEWRCVAILSLVSFLLCIHCLHVFALGFAFKQRSRAVLRSCPSGGA